MWKKLYKLLLTAGSQAIIAHGCFVAGEIAAGAILSAAAALTGALGWIIGDDDVQPSARKQRHLRQKPLLELSENT